MAIRPTVETNAEFILRRGVGQAITRVQTSQCDLLAAQDAKKRNDGQGGSLDSATNRIVDLTRQLRGVNAVYIAQALIEQHVSELQQLIDSTISEHTTLLKQVVPLLALPLSPLAVVKWVKKLAVGNFIPQLRAAIRFVRRVVALVDALNQLIEACEAVVESIKDLPEQAPYILRAQINGVVDRTILTIRNTIEEEIANTICNELKKNNVSGDTVLDVLDTAAELDIVVRSLNQTRNILQSRLGDTLGMIGEAQTFIADSTGIQPVYDVSTPDAFLGSLEGPSSDNYFGELDQFAQQMPPALEGQIVIQGTGQLGSPLTVPTDVWVSNTAVSFSYRWFRDTTPIEGANTNPYIPVFADVGFPLYAEVTAENAAGIVIANTEPSPIITNPYNIPTNTVLPVITGTSSVGSTVTCGTGTWTGTAPITFAYQWLYAKTRTPIFGANTATYQLTVDDINRSLVCRVTATNIATSVTVESAVFNGPGS